MLKKIIGVSLVFVLSACGGSSSIATTPPIVVTQTPAVISGVDTGAVTNNVVFITNGSLTISDAQSGEAAFQEQTDVLLDLGSFTITDKVYGASR